MIRQGTVEQDEKLSMVGIENGLYILQMQISTADGWQPIKKKLIIEKQIGVLYTVSILKK